MSDEVYTLGVWNVTDGKADEFISAWSALGNYFQGLPHPPGQGCLIQSLDDPNLFYSFGPWRSLEDVEYMRSRPDARTAIGNLLELCDEGQPGTFRLVATA